MNANLEQGFNAYKTYVAVKNHFTSPYYDYFKYGGNVKAGWSTFERRNDKYFFVKLAKKRDIKGFLIANMIDNQSNWIGDVINNANSDKVYTKWLSRQQSLLYVFKTDLEQLLRPFDLNFVVVDGQHPPLLVKVLRKEISIETVIILNSLCGFFNHWTRAITDTFIWPSFKMKCSKYRPFVVYENDRFKKTVVDIFAEHE